ncbi:MAG: insulinase family protein, partial [Bacteroidia bacterium]|nr:insulinase family protein [Bacteroidia bacterium]
KNIREEKGLTYGVSASLHAMQHDSYLVIGTDVNKENRELTFSEIAREVQQLQTERVPDSELDTARYHFIGSLQSDLSTPFAHADKWKNILLFDLPEEYYTSLLQRLQSATADQLIEVARKHFNNESFLQVSAG